jgi:hypothetical protein
MNNAPRLDTAILTDLSKELHERIAKTIYSMTGIVDHPLDKFQVSLGALASAMAINAGFMSASCGHKFNPYDVAAAIIEMLRTAQTPEQRREMEAALQGLLRSKKP